MSTERTLKSKVRSTLRQLWLRSKERASALKRDKYTCQRCGRKQSKAKGKEISVQVHHIHNITNWDKMIDPIFEELLCDPKGLQTLCSECHDKETKEGGDKVKKDAKSSAKKSKKVKTKRA